MSSSDSSDWDDIEVVAAEETTGDSFQPLVAPQTSHRDNRTMLLLLEGKTSTSENQDIAANAGGVFDSSNNNNNKNGVRDPIPTNPMALLASTPSRARSLAFIGAHLHGKSALVKDLIGRRNRLMPSATYDSQRGLTTQMYCQHALLRGNSNGTGAPCLVAVIDTPGHSNFAAEVHPALLLAEAVALVVDAVEGVTAMTEQLLDSAVAERVPVFLVISKIDRIMIELRIPPADAYKKLKHIVDSVNVLLETRSAPLVSPAHGTVVFVSAHYSTAFSLPSVARKYQEQFGQQIRISWLAAQLWGNVTFDNASRKFTQLESKIGGPQQKPSFVSFILDPLYKAMLNGLKQEQQPQKSSNNNNNTNNMTISKLIRESISNIFGAYHENLPECLFQGMNESILARSKNQTQNKKPYVVSILENSFGMPSNQAASAAMLRGLAAAHASPYENIDEGNIEIKKKSSNNNSNNNRDDDDDAHGSSLALPFGIIAGKVRLTSDVSSSSTSSTRISRVFAIVRIMSGFLEQSSTETNHNNNKIRIYSGPDSELLLASAKMICLIKNHDELVPIRKACAGAVVLVDFFAPSLEDMPTLANASSTSSSSLPKEISITSTISTPSLVIPNETENNNNNTYELLPVTDTASRTSYKKGIFSTLTKVSIQPASIKDLKKLEETMTQIVSERKGLELTQENELVLSGIGEVQLDSVLYDVRRHVEIRATAPFTAFSETVAASPQGVLRRHGANDIAFSAFAAPMGKQTEQFVSHGGFASSMGLFKTKTSSTSSSSSHCFSAIHQLNSKLRQDCGWDLVDCDTLVDVVGSSDTNDGCLLFCDWKRNRFFDQFLLLHNTSGNNSNGDDADDYNIRRWMVSSLGSALQRGPLCGEPVRGVSLSFIDCLKPGGVSPSQASVTSTARLLATKTLLAAAPRLLEPVMEITITLPGHRVEEVSEMLRKRRGAVQKEIPIPATSWSTLQGLIPLADSFGFETAVRVGTQGDAFPMMTFREWQMVPGDPLDASLRVSPYEPASGVHLARDFVMKTRKRKGMSDAIPLM